MTKQDEKVFENQEKENQTSEAKEEVVLKQQFDGIKHDLIEERSKRQFYATQLEQTQQQLKELQEKMKLLEKSKEDEVLNNLIPGDEDEPITKGQLKQAYQQMKQEEIRLKEQQEFQMRQQAFNQSINQARVKYQNRAKYGLDFDSLRPIIDQKLNEEAQGNPFFVKSLYYKQNPGEYLYKMALEDPDVQARLKIMNNEKVLDDMENRKTDKSNLESDTAPSRPKMLTEKEIARMNPKEARKRMKEIEEYMRSSVKK